MDYRQKDMIQNLDTAFSMIHSCKKEIEHTAKGTMSARSLVEIASAAQDIIATVEWIKWEVIEELKSKV